MDVDMEKYVAVAMHLTEKMTRCTGDDMAGYMATYYVYD